MNNDFNLKATYETLAELNARVADMYHTGASLPSLGNMALELLALKSRFDEHKGEMNVKTYETVNKTLQELEKSIISLYMLSLMGEKKTRRVQDYLFSEYSIYER